MKEESKLSLFLKCVHPMTPDGLVSLNMPGPGKIEPFLTINNLH